MCEIYQKNHIPGSGWDRKIYDNKKRRKEQLRHRGLLLFLFLCFICAGIWSANSIISKAGTDRREDISVKCYKNIMVQVGDTLTDIAEVYRDEEHYPSAEKYVKEVMLMNHLSEPQEIRPGDYLIIPYYTNDMN